MFSCQHCTACRLLLGLCPPVVPGPNYGAQARSTAKARQSRGLDLEEVRRRTSLLSGEARTSNLATQTSSSGITATSSPLDAFPLAATQRRWLPPDKASSSPRGISHPLHSESTDPLFAAAAGRGGTFDDRGNYFNEDLLVSRAKSSGGISFDPLDDGRPAMSGATGQGSWRGDVFMDTAGSLITTARFVCRVPNRYDTGLWSISEE